MTWVADHLLRFMVNRNAIENEKDILDFYKYGIEITVSTILSMVLIMLLGLIIHAFIYSLAFLITFVIIRSLVGGFHASTYFKCNLMMCITFLGTAFLSKIIETQITLKVGIILSVIILLAFAILGPIENVHKPIPNENKMKLKILGVIIGLIFALAGNLLIKNNIEIGTMIILTMMLIVILMIVAKIKERI